MRKDKKTQSHDPFAIAGMFLQVGAHEPLKKKGEALAEKVTSPLEDLTKEHGALERLLLIYDRIINDTASGREFNVQVANRATRVMKDYIEEHHEKCEERYIFPKFREANYIVELIDILLYQHDVANGITEEILKRLSPGNPMGENDVNRVIDLCSSLVYMYRPHVSREQTILFPAFYDIVTVDYIEDIKEKMEDEERKLLGETGFRGLIGCIGEIEKEAGTHDLPQYTPRTQHARH